MATWPTAIVITRDNYKETPPNNVIRTNMDVGPAKLRRRTTANIRPVELSLVLTDDLLDTFDAFYLANDALRFDFPNPRTEETVSARFANTPDYTLNETVWNVKVSLEILP